MQPTYIPWSGFFNLIANVDIFVFLDDAQFERSTWHHRNQILSQGQPLLLSIPVKRSGLYSKINEVQPDDAKNWRKKHIQSITQNYSKTKFKNEIISVFKIIENGNKSLSEMNISIIKHIVDLLGLQVRFYLASELKVEGKRTQRVVNICDYFGIKDYYSPLGAKEYLLADQYYSLTANRLFFQDYTPSDYLQIGKFSFVSHLSILDVIANLGITQTTEYVRSGKFILSNKED